LSLNPRQRLGDLSAARLLLARARQRGPNATAPPRTRSAVPTAAACIVAALAIGSAGYVIGSRGSAARPAARVLELTLPTTFTFGAPATAVLSPDGARLA
jgi:hypothetical protein